MTIGRNLELPIAEPFFAASDFSLPSSTSFRLRNASMAELPAALRSTEACLRISTGPASSSRGSLPVPGPKTCSPLLAVEDEEDEEESKGVWRPIVRRPIGDGNGAIAG